MVGCLALGGVLLVLGVLGYLTMLAKYALAEKELELKLPQNQGASLEDLDHLAKRVAELEKKLEPMVNERAARAIFRGR